MIPAQAAVMNLLSIGAAYGVLTAIFQFGWLHGLIGLDGAVPIVSYVPLFMFAVLFGLSMDYEVFLVSQIKEHVHAGEDTKRSVVSGLVTSGRVITAAATIMVFVFGSFVLNGDPTVKQFGIGLAVAVILDATVVRCLLVPARMVRLGKCQLVPAPLARPAPAPHQHRGRGILQSPRPDPAGHAAPGPRGIHRGVVIAGRCTGRRLPEFIGVRPRHRPPQGLWQGNVVSHPSRDKPAVFRGLQHRDREHRIPEPGDGALHV